MTYIEIDSKQSAYDAAYEISRKLFDSIYIHPKNAEENISACFFWLMPLTLDEICEGYSELNSTDVEDGTLDIHTGLYFTPCIDNKIPGVFKTNDRGAESLLAEWQKNGDGRHLFDMEFES